MFDTMINNIAQHKHFDAEGRDNEEHATKKNLRTGEQSVR